MVSSRFSCFFCVLKCWEYYVCNILDLRLIPFLACREKKARCKSSLHCKQFIHSIVSVDTIDKEEHVNLCYWFSFLFFSFLEMNRLNSLWSVFIFLLLPFGNSNGWYDLNIFSFFGSKRKKRKWCLILFSCIWECIWSKKVKLQYCPFLDTIIGKLWRHCLIRWCEDRNVQEVTACIEVRFWKQFEPIVFP